MNRLLVIDGNSIINRAFYGIMGNKMLMTADGTYTNAVYGFLAILFKILDDLDPEYMAIAFDLKAPTQRHKLYEGYKATRKGMPDELASQMPILKNILKAMNITIIEKEGYEADDILGTLSKKGEESNLQVTILSGDRDTFQLITPNISVRIPRTKGGKTETEDYTVEKINEVYNLQPKDLIEVKGLMGDTSDNIPGIPGVGEKTALSLVKKYGTIENLYETIEKGEDDLKGALKKKVVDNKELAFLSKQLGTINKEVPLEIEIEDIKRKEWNKDEVLELFKELRFQRFIERFNLEEGNNQSKNLEDIFQMQWLEGKSNLWEEIKEQKKMYYNISLEKDTNLDTISKKKVCKFSIYSKEKNTVYELKKQHMQQLPKELKAIFEDTSIEKISYAQKEDYVVLKEMGIEATNMAFDVKIAAYLLNSTSNQYSIEELAIHYLNLNFDAYLKQIGKEEQNQMSLFAEQKEETISEENALKVYCIYKLKEKLTQELEEIEAWNLFKNIEMPLVEVLAQMQYTGIYLDKEELMKYGKELQQEMHNLEQEIYELCGETFNINSPKQLGEVLFEKIGLPVYKKKKTGYSTDVDTLEKLKNHHPSIEKILEYRQVSKLNSTFVEGMIPYINERTKRVHSNFHQTVTTTGRISSTEPNMQNIPTRMEIGKPLRKVFKPKDGYIFLDADYSQIELRIFAHISQDEEMIKAFNQGEDIHAQAASKVFNVPLEEVSSSLRSKAKAVNFGIVYGISDYGLAEQIGVSKKEAKQYIEQYLEKYSGIKKYMEEIPELAKEKGYVETLFKRRRYIPELSSNNYMVRQFGVRAAMNTPIQGTAADIMKIAMLNVYKELREKKLDANLVLQVHDELLIEVKIEEKEEASAILKKCMENVIKLSIPLEVEVKAGYSWQEAK